ncbi:hypothetical protein ACWDRX_31640, partial [Streptomyces nigra]
MDGRRTAAGSDGGLALAPRRGVGAEEVGAARLPGGLLGLLLRLTAYAGSDDPDEAAGFLAEALAGDLD